MLDNTAISLQNSGMWIEREAEQVVRRYAKGFPVLIVTGARQVGKTSLLRHCFPSANYVSLDDPARAAVAEARPREFLRELETPVIIDEVQYVPELFRYLKLAVDSGKSGPGRFLLAGSQVFSLMRHAGQSLAGRTGILDLPTLSIRELRRAFPRRSIGELSLTGGYPALYQSGELGPGQWFPSYVSSYLERDVRSQIAVGNLRDFYRFVRAAAARSARLLVYSELARDVGVVPNTIRAWLSVLERSGIVFLVEPYFENVGKRVVKSPKLFFADSGLLHHLVGVRREEEAVRSPLSGALWESSCVTEVRKHLLQHPGGMSLWFWRTREGAEVDIVLEAAGRFDLIECKLTETPNDRDAAGIHAFRKAFTEKRVRSARIVCRTERSFPLGRGVEAVGMADIYPPL